MGKSPNTSGAAGFVTWWLNHCSKRAFTSWNADATKPRGFQKECKKSQTYFQRTSAYCEPEEVCDKRDECVERHLQQGSKSHGCNGEQKGYHWENDWNFGRSSDTGKSHEEEPNCHRALKHKTSITQSSEKKQANCLDYKNPYKQTEEQPGTQKKLFWTLPIKITDIRFLKQLKVSTLGVRQR